MTSLYAAVSTAPRCRNYLDATIQSLLDAGFRDLHFVIDWNQSGAWPTFQRAIRQGLEARADVIAVFQDDIEVSFGAARLFSGSFMTCAAQRRCQQILRDEHDQIGLISLYTAAPNHRDEPGWYTLADCPLWRPYGALAIVMPRHSAQKLLDLNLGQGGCHQTDTNLGEFCRLTNLKWWMHSPSFVRHTGIHSAISWGQPQGVQEHTEAHLDERPERNCKVFCRDVGELE